MKFTIYEDPVTHQFALLALPSRFVQGDKLPIGPVDRWFATREKAVAALPDLLNRDSAMVLDAAPGPDDPQPS